MQKHKNISVDHSDVNRAPSRQGGCFSRPDPEEGHRLIRSFLSIRQPALRQAIVARVDELQKLGDETQWSLTGNTKLSA
jgi:hypothetical protein